MRFFGNDNYGLIAQIARFNPDDIFALVRKPQAVTRYSTVLCDGKEYRVHLASNSLRLFKKSRECAACGLIGSTMFLEERFDKQKKERFHAFSLYAEARHYPEEDPYFIRMTIDHIIPKRKGGDNRRGNLQVMCASCNYFKEHTDLDAKDIKRSICMMKRIIYSGRANRRMRELNKSQTIAIKNLSTSIEKMESHLAAIPPEKKNILLKKLEERRQIFLQKKKEFDAFVLDAQIRGSATEAFGVEKVNKKVPEILDEALQSIKKIQFIRDEIDAEESLND